MIPLSRREQEVLIQINYYEEMSPIALNLESHLPQPLVMCYGPICTKSKGFKKANKYYFEQIIRRLKNDRINIFNQLIFENITCKTKANQAGYPFGLLNDFYFPLFQSGLIKTLYFISGWESSFGNC